RHIIMLPARMLRILERPRRKPADVGEGVSVFVLPIRQQQKFLQRFQVSARPLRWIVGGGLVSPRTQVEEKGLLADKITVVRQRVVVAVYPRRVVHPMLVDVISAECRIAFALFEVMLDKPSVGIVLCRTA